MCTIERIRRWSVNHYRSYSLIIVRLVQIANNYDESIPISMHHLHVKTAQIHCGIVLTDQCRKCILLMRILPA